MKIENIIKRFESKGYNLTKSISTGNIIITAPWGAISTFNSYNAAYKYYF